MYYDTLGLINLRSEIRDLARDIEYDHLIGVLIVTQGLIVYIYSLEKLPTLSASSSLELQSRITSIIYIQFNSDICTRQLINYHVGARDEHRKHDPQVGDFKKKSEFSI